MSITDLTQIPEGILWEWKHIHDRFDDDDYSVFWHRLLLEDEIELVK